METIISLASNVGTLLLLLIAYKAGLLKFLLNGKNGGVENQIKEMQDNHLHSLQEGIDEIKSCNKDIKNILSNIEKYGIRCRKKDE